MNPNYTEFKFPQIKAHPWNKVFSTRTPADAIDLLSKILVYDPAQRFTPMEALKHSFFEDLRDKNTKLPNGAEMPDLFNFTREEISTTDEETIKKLTPDWYKEDD